MDASFSKAPPLYPLSQNLLEFFFILHHLADRQTAWQWNWKKHYCPTIMSVLILWRWKLSVKLEQAFDKEQSTSAEWGSRVKTWTWTRTLFKVVFKERNNESLRPVIETMLAPDWQSSRNCTAETYFNRTAQHTGSHVALANIHNMLDQHPECVPSQVLNLTWFQKGAEVTQRPVWGTNSSHAIRWRQILYPDNQHHISSFFSLALLIQLNPLLNSVYRNARLTQTWIQLVQLVDPFKISNKMENWKTQALIWSTCMWTKSTQTRSETQLHFQCLTFEGQEDSGSRQWLIGSGHPPRR